MTDKAKQASLDIIRYLFHNEKTITYQEACEYVEKRIQELAQELAQEYVCLLVQHHDSRYTRLQPGDVCHICDGKIEETM